jgi:2-polyprenyl-6-methoxyphenol hydroxylase-like FAD-dependent oxidoreductase
MTKSKTFAIVGGGIGGLTTAIALQKSGFNVAVYESAPEFKPLGAGIVLAANAIKAFQAIGLEKEIIAAGNELKRFTINDAGGTLLTNTDAEKVNQKFGLVSALALHRADLHEVLFRQLKSGTVINGKLCIGFVQSANNVTVHFADGTSVVADYVIAAFATRAIRAGER